MAKKLYEESNIAAIAAKIREKTGTETKYKTAEMPAGVEEVYTAGLQAEYDRFWDAYQENGNRTGYAYGFSGLGFYKDTFQPKYDIRPANAAMMFSWKTNEYEPYDLVEHLAKLGITLDFSGCTSFAGTFSYCYYFSRVGIIDASRATTISEMFTTCKNLETIDKLILPTKDVSYSSAFTNLHKLKNLVVEGEFKQNFSIQQSTMLTHDSLMSIINALADYSSSGTTHTVNFGATNLAKLTDAEKAIATEKGWTLA